MTCCSRREGMNPTGANVIATRICNVISWHFKEMAIAAVLQHPRSQKSNQKCIMTALMQSSFLLPSLQQLLV